MSEIDLLIEELEDIENNPIKPFVAIRIGGYLRNYKYHEYRIAELESAQARGDKLKRITHWISLPESSNDTQKDTFVYGKDSKPIPCPFCGEIVKECNDVATPPEVQE